MSTYWSIYRFTYLKQSALYWSAMSWWVCHARSMSSVGTKNDAGEDVMRSRNLQEPRNVKGNSWW
jgi:hypothetical protein